MGAVANGQLGPNIPLIAADNNGYSTLRVRTSRTQYMTFENTDVQPRRQHADCVETTDRVLRLGNE